MPTLVINPDTPSEWRVALPPGTTTIARSPDLGIGIDHPSVSNPHCTILVTRHSLLLRDLGSEQGTFVRGERVTESTIHPGAALQFGAVLARIDPDSGTPPIPGKPGMAASPAPNRGEPGPAPRGSRFAEALRYPLQGEGWMMLLAGAIFFGLLGIGSGFFLPLALLGGGLMVAYLQQVIQASAARETTLPKWPDLSDVMDLLRCLLLYVGIVLLTVGVPLRLLSLEDTGGLVSALCLGWLGIGMFILPMGLLAVALFDTFSALNPLFLFRSITATFGDYLVTWLALGLLTAANTGLDWLLDRPGLFRIGGFVSGTIGLYLMVVQCRLLGSFYADNKPRLGWFKR